MNMIAAFVLRLAAEAILTRAPCVSVEGEGQVYRAARALFRAADAYEAP